MKQFIPALIIFASCSSPNMESRIQNYMKDSIVVNFNDPGSYEFVSIDKPDTVSNYFFLYSEKLKHLEVLQVKTAEKGTNDIEKINDDLQKTGSDLDKQISDNHKKVDSLIGLTINIENNAIEKIDNELKQPDFVHHLNYNVKYRGKNKMGALILDDITLSYYPKENKIVPVKDVAGQ